MLAVDDVMSSVHSRLSNVIAMVILFLMATGAVMVFSAGANLGYEFDLRRFYDFPGLRQIMFFPIAVLVLFVASLPDYRILESSLPLVQVADRVAAGDCLRVADRCSGRRARRSTGPGGGCGFRWDRRASAFSRLSSRSGR